MPAPVHRAQEDEGDDGGCGARANGGPSLSRGRTGARQGARLLSGQEASRRATRGMAQVSPRKGAGPRARRARSPTHGRARRDGRRMSFAHARRAMMSRLAFSRRLYQSVRCYSSTFCIEYRSSPRRRGSQLNTACAYVTGRLTGALVVSAAPSRARARVCDCADSLSLRNANERSDRTELAIQIHSLLIIVLQTTINTIHHS